MVSLIADVDTTAEAAVSGAVRALYAAKRAGRGRLHLAGESGEASALSHSSLETELALGIERDELFLDRDVVKGQDSLGVEFR